MPHASWIPGHDGSIAIVGLSCRFPGDASTPTKFWELLKDAKNAFAETTDRYNADAFYHPRSGSVQNVIPTKGGYFLKQDLYEWDAAFFNITAAEAMALDPRQRIAMEVTYEALENAGMPLRKVSGSQTACYMGSSMSDCRDSVSRDFGNYPKYHILGMSDEMIANRISHFLNIHGPSATVQTACSSSLVSTHIACQGLRSGESDMAIAGGVGLILGTEGTSHLNNLGFLDPAGHSRSFDADAGGYGRGEGCGVLILKRLEAAIQDGDNIRAVIRATGVNSDGWTPGVTMPSLAAQAALIKNVYERSGLDYGSTQYVEAHVHCGKAGDPIETKAIHQTIGQSKWRKRLYIGSVKPNIGHLEAAAGVASIIKGVLALEHGMIPPNINFTKPNPSIPLDEWNMVVPTRLTPWPAAQTKRMSISGFGMGGTNAHVVLDGYNPPAQTTNGVSTARKSTSKRLFLLSSQDKAGFRRVGQSLSEYLGSLGAAASSPAYLSNLSHTLAKARSGLAWRDAIIAENAAELREQLTNSLGAGAVRAPSSAPRIGFVFTGQGAQWARMGIEMMDRSVFSASIARSAQYLRDLGSEWDPVNELSAFEKESRLGVPLISQPICTVLQIALVDELRSWGVTPSKVVGHSSGEIAAAYTLGALSHRDAVAAAYYRGTVSSAPKLAVKNGGMMAVGCSPDEATALMQENKLSATVACVNSPSSVTLSGDVKTLEAIKAILNSRGTFAKRLKVGVAYHSTHMHSVSMDYYAAIAEIGQDDISPELQQQRESVTMVSSVSGQEVDASDLGPYYWVQNLISPVLFADAVKELVLPANGNGEKTVDLLIEIGPHSALGGPIEQTLRSITGVNYTSMLVRNQSALDTSMALAADLFRRGVSFDVAKVNADANCKLLTDLPPYAWNHSQKFSAIGRMQREQYAQQFPTRSLLGAMMPTMGERERVWRSFIRLNDEPWLRGHMVGSTVLFPAAGMVSIALEAAQQVVEAHKSPLSFKLRDVSFVAAMALTEDMATETVVQMRPHLLATAGNVQSSWWEFNISSCAGPAGQMRENCRGLISIVYGESRSTYMAQEDAQVEALRIADYRAVLNELPETCSKASFYDCFAKSGFPYGEIFQGVETCHPGVGKTCYEVKVVDIGETFTRGKLERPFLIHAATLDSMWQGWVGSTQDYAVPGELGTERPLVPTSLGELEVSMDIPGDIGYLMPGIGRSRRHGFDEFSADITMFDKDLSKVVVSVSDFHLSPLEVDSGAEAGAAAVVDPAEIASEIHWNYLLDAMEPKEIEQALLSTDPATPDARLLQLIRMVIHQHPAAHVIELVHSQKDLPYTAMSKLPKGVIHPTQVHYAVVEEEGSVSDEVFGHPFALGSLDAPLPADIAPADLFVVPYDLSPKLKRSLDSYVDRLVRMAKPGAMVAIATPAAIPAQDVKSPTLKGKGFDLVSSIPADGEILAYYKQASEKQVNGLFTNGTHQEDVVIIVPAESSKGLQSFVEKLQDLLHVRGYGVTVEKWTPEIQSGDEKSYIGLLELEKSFLENLSEPDFLAIRDLMLTAKRLLWVTCGDSPSLQIVDGLARCVNLEVAASNFQVLHLSREGQKFGPSLVTRVLDSFGQSPDHEFREVGGLLQVPRAYEAPDENQQIRNHLQDSVQNISLNDDSAAFRLAIGKPGLLGSLHFIRDESLLAEPLGDDELELDVKATGVNFRDVMACMGLVAVPGLGVEASGVVLKAGKNARNMFQPGDRVSTVSLGGAHATRTRCDYRVTAVIPDAMSLEEAAAVPTVHATAYFALVRLAKCREGQTVLIHAAAGGVGQAAIQLAQHIGLIVYATVGTADKRQLLKEQYGIPDEHIFNSRDSSFAKGIQRVTGGRGVDCLLNSLSGELLRVSWMCLAPFGTFVEIGTRDITDNMRLDMRPFAKSATFTSFDIPTTIKEDPAALGEALHSAFHLLLQGKLHVPKPLTVYPCGQAESAFRTVQQGKHRGKLVLSFSDESKTKAPVMCKAKDSLRLDPGLTYLIVGGLGGLGRSLAKEFVASGARHLAFMSRSGDSKPEAKATVDQLENLGARIKVLRADVADQTAFRKAMEECEQEFPPIKGVIQMAMVLRDTLMEKMSYEDWRIPVEPKVQGTWNLHQYFDKERPLDFMIFCSSFTGVVGNPGQAQYAAGNSYQEALAIYRRQQGLKAVSVDLGIMTEVGILHELRGHTFKQWEEVLGIRESTFKALMKSLINAQQNRRDAERQCPPHLTLGLATGDIIAAHGLPPPPWFQDVRFGPLAVVSNSSWARSGGDDKGAGAPLATQLAAAGQDKDFAAAATIITGALAAKLADILRIPLSEIDSTRPMYSYGVDSLVALEVRNWITREIKANMALLDILAAVPMETFASQIAQKSKLVVG
ncbi:putative polyketide synthase, partial [Aureobasidium melanogenum]